MVLKIWPDLVSYPNIKFNGMVSPQIYISIIWNSISREVICHIQYHINVTLHFVFLKTREITTPTAMAYFAPGATFIVITWHHFNWDRFWIKNLNFISTTIFCTSFLRYDDCKIEMFLLLKGKDIDVTLSRGGIYEWLYAVWKRNLYPHF